MGLAKDTATMMVHEDLRTLEIHTDWDVPLIRKLSSLAIFYCDEGVWEGLNEQPCTSW